MVTFRLTNKYILQSICMFYSVSDPFIRYADQKQHRLPLTRETLSVFDKVVCESGYRNSEDIPHRNDLRRTSVLLKRANQNVSLK